MITTARSLCLVLLVSLAAVACGSPSSRAPAASAVTTTSATSLDGATYDVSLAFPGEAPISDSLVFVNGKFESTACTSMGFPEWTNYEARAERGGTSFAVTTHNPGGASIEWTGTVRAGAVEGSLVRTMNGQRAVGHFKGNLHG